MADSIEQHTANITYTQAGLSCFVGQKSGKFKVPFIVGSSVAKISAELLQNVGQHTKSQPRKQHFWIFPTHKSILTDQRNKYTGRLTVCTRNSEFTAKLKFSAFNKSLSHTVSEVLLTSYFSYTQNVVRHCKKAIQIKS